MSKSFTDVCNMAESFYHTFEFPNGEHFKVCKKSESKAFNSYSGKIVYGSIEFLITLQILKPSMDSRVTVRPLIGLSDIERIQYARALPTIIRTVPLATEVSRNNTTPDFTEHINHKEYDTDNILAIRIGKLLTTAHICTQALLGFLRNNHPMPSSATLQQMCTEAFSKFCKDCFVEEAPTKQKLPNKDNHTGSSSMSEKEFEEFFKQWKADSEKRQQEAKSIKDASSQRSYAWLRGTKFSTREKEILTIFRDNIKRKV